MRRLQAQRHDVRHLRHVENEDARQEHLDGQIPAALGQVAEDLLAAAPDIRPLTSSR